MMDAELLRRQTAEQRRDCEGERVCAADEPERRPVLAVGAVAPMSALTIGIMSAAEDADERH